MEKVSKVKNYQTREDSQLYLISIHSLRWANCNTDHYLMVMIIWENMGETVTKLGNGAKFYSRQVKFN